MDSQGMSEQRQSVRFDREFLVTDHEDESFAEPFVGHDVNLTGLSFWVENADWFLPGQVISLRLKNLENSEEYCLDGVEVVHLQNHGDRILCGCHISHVSSSQLLAHHRTVVVDDWMAHQVTQSSALEDFDFDEEGATCTENLSDFQELIMVSLLQYEQLKKDYGLNKRLLSEMQTFIASTSHSEFNREVFSEHFSQLESMHHGIFQQQLSWGLFAKLLAFTPKDKADRQAWQTMIADFEALHLSEKQQVAFDFMHQGTPARKALGLAKEFVRAEESTQLELDVLE